MKVTDGRRKYLLFCLDMQDTREAVFSSQRRLGDRKHPSSISHTHRQKSDQMGPDQERPQCRNSFFFFFGLAKQTEKISVMRLLLGETNLFYLERCTERMSCPVWLEEVQRL